MMLGFLETRNKKSLGASCLTIERRVRSTQISFERKVGHQI